MFGTAIGDIAGSRFEFGKEKPDKEFELFDPACVFTDDTVLTAAVCRAILENKDLTDAAALRRSFRVNLQRFAIDFPFAGYGPRFYAWADRFELFPYNSFGNGAASRISPVAWVGKTVEEVFTLSDICTGVTHSHREGLKGARAVTLAVFLARHGVSREKIRESIQKRFYLLDFTLDGIRETYVPSGTCQGTVPFALEAFLESEDFESAVRNAVSLGGDTDTLGAIAGAVAEAYYGVPEVLKEKAVTYLDRRLTAVFSEFEEKYQTRPV